MPPEPRVIDSHHHFWHYTPDEYGWISDDMAALRRHFLPADLKTAIDAAGVDAVISVQARQSVAETEWLLDLASRHDFIAAVVGWAPLIDERAGALLDRFAAHPKLKGLRHVLQDEPDPRYMLQHRFQRGLREVTRLDLAYDILIYERHLPEAIELVDLHPHQRFVLDHIAKPRIRDGAMSPWRERMRELARRGNVWCKLSGVVTEAAFHSWTEEQVLPYMEAALEAFTPSRLMFGTDWPVCLCATGYTQWTGMVRRLIAALSPDEQRRILGANAAEAYKLPPAP